MSMVEVKYGTFKLSPAPNIEYSTDIKRSEAGYMIGTVDKITLNGIIYHNSDKLNDVDVSSTPNSFTELIGKLNNIKSALEEDYKSLEINCDSTNIYRSDPNVTYVDSFKFSNSSDEVWVQIIDYSIEISVYNTGTVQNPIINYITENNYLVSNFVDTYTITTNDENFYEFNQNNVPSLGITHGMSFPSYTIVRTLSANGVETQNRSAIDNAKHFISGIKNSSNHTFDLMLENLSIYDRSTKIDQNPINGVFSINDTFMAYSGTLGWTDQYTITNTFDQNLKRTTEIVGEVKGFDLYNSSNNALYDTILNNTFSTQNDIQGYVNNKFSLASGGFFNHVSPNMLSKASGSWSNNISFYRGVTPPSGKYPINTGINPIPLSVSINYDIVNGSVRYNYTYDSRPVSAITEAISESVDISDNYSIRAYVFPEVFYRPPIAQDMGTYSSNSKRQVTYSATFPKPFIPGNTTDITNRVKNFVKKFDPSGLSPLSSPSNRGPRLFSWIVDNSENYDVLLGKYTYSVTWEYQKAFIPATPQPTSFNP